MKRYPYLAAVCSAVLLVYLASTGVNAQVRYARGQDVGPIYEGWEQNPDGTYTMHFGYLNRNSEEELDIPIGPDNKFDMGNGDQGQPTHFYAGRKWWVFKVVVPKDWPKDKRLTWTLATRGVTNYAKGWLQAEWEIEKLLIVKNAPRDSFLTGLGGVPDEDNVYPSVVTSSSPPTITLPDTAAISVTATDDGRPNPDPSPRARRQPGVAVRWIHYRGPGKVSFNPNPSQPVYGKQATHETKASFSAPGIYRLRAIVNDGQLFTTYDVDVTVK